MKRIWWLSLCLFVAVPGVGMAISNGQPDGNDHPAVGSLFVDLNRDGKIIAWDDQFGCGSLISPTVFLVAAHQVAPVVAAGFTPFYVSFNTNIGIFDPVPDLIEATGYDWTRREANPHGDDLGIIILPEGSTAGITPVDLPPANLLGVLKADGALKGQEFTSVGYGIASAGIGVPFRAPLENWSFDGLRNQALSPFAALDKGFLYLLANEDATGEGGACYGDSGGPQFIGDTNTIVSLTSSGDRVCRAINVNTRVDTVNAREFLGRYVTLP